uniref:Uncharacterized protein n=1 Tax=Oryza rufipogon TaxID=4529 RepID=A0A0E0R5Q1_ORYRU
MVTINKETTRHGAQFDGGGSDWRSNRWKQTLRTGDSNFSVNDAPIKALNSPGIFASVQTHQGCNYTVS